ncbi:MAG: hypothetical protein N2C14_30420, partial [Planctomycetales bacterium]
MENRVLATPREIDRKMGCPLRCLFGMGLACLLSVFASAADPVAGSVAEPTAEEIARAVRNLGDDLFHVREKASEQLWGMGRLAEPALQKALRGGDPEVVRRARVILERLSWGLGPDTSPEIQRLVSEYRFGDPTVKRKAVEQLLQKADVAYDVLLAIVSHEREEDFRRHILGQLGTKLNLAVRQLMLRGNTRVAERMLELQAASGSDPALRNLVAFLLIQDRLKPKIREYQARVEKNADHTSVQVLVYLLRADGNLEGAEKVAAGAGYGSLLNSILYEKGEWAKLAERNQGAAEGESIEKIGFLTAYCRLAGKDKQFEALADKLRDWKTEEGASSESWYQAEALLLNERVDDAVNVLRKGKTTRAVFDLLCARLRFSEAFELADQAPDAASGFSLRLQKAKQWYFLGEREKANKLLLELGDKKTLLENPVRGYLAPLVEIKIELDLTDEALAHCELFFDREKSDKGDWPLLLGKLFPKKGGQAESWWDYLDQQSPDDPPLAKLNRLRSLMRPSKEQLPELKAAAEKILENSGGPAENQEATSKRIKRLQAVGETC